MFKLLSRDGQEVFKCSEAFFRAFNYVNLSFNKWAFMQKSSTGMGRVKDGKFNGFYAYSSKINLDFRTNYNNFPNAEIDFFKYDINDPTYCNHAFAVYLSNCGFIDLALGFKIFDPNKIFDKLTGSFKEYADIEKIDHSFITFNEAVAGPLVIAIQKIPTGIGHVAPVVGRGKDGKIYVANIGAIKRDGIVDVEYAFTDKLENISFFNIAKKRD